MKKLVGLFEILLLFPLFLRSEVNRDNSDVNAAGTRQFQSISTLSDCGHFNGWNLKRIPKLPHSLTELKVGEHNGDQFCSARFELRETDPQINDGWRSELSDPFIPKVETQMTYGFSTFIPSAGIKGIEQLVIAQWHDNKLSGVPSQRPPLSIRIRDNKLVVPIWNNKIHLNLGQSGLGKVIYEIPIPTDRWINFVVDVNWREDNRGFVRLYVDNRLVARYQGPIGYKADITAPYFKIGAYTTRRFIDTQIVVLHTDYTRNILEDKVDLPPGQ